MQVIHKPKPKPELMTQTELLAYVHELEAENARLEESFQKATGAVAADALPTLAEMRKVKQYCENTPSCAECKYRYEAHGRYDCIFGDEPTDWLFGGADE